MDVNEDGRLDILSGSYSRKKVRPMAGLFQVLYGKEGGGFAQPTPLTGKGETPLVFKKPKQDRGIICTRPFAADWDRDGHLDLIVGEMQGEFLFVRGRGDGRFESRGTWIREGNKRTGKLLKAPGGHGDPFVVDFDRDGDLDLVSGASNGGVYWAENVASPDETPRLKPFETLQPGIEPQMVVLGGDSPSRYPMTTVQDLRQPGRATRVWVADYDGDGKLDLLVGDRITLRAPAKGKSAAEASAAIAEFEKRSQKLMREQMTAQGDAARGRARTAYIEHLNTRATVWKEHLIERSSGTIWLIRQK